MAHLRSAVPVPKAPEKQAVTINYSRSTSVETDISTVTQRARDAGRGRRKPRCYSGGFVLRLETHAPESAPSPVGSNSQLASPIHTVIFATPCALIHGPSYKLIRYSSRPCLSQSSIQITGPECPFSLPSYRRKLAFIFRLQKKKRETLCQIPCRHPKTQKFIVSAVVPRNHATAAPTVATGIGPWRTSVAATNLSIQAFSR